MKKYDEKRRNRDVLIALRHRKHNRKAKSDHAKRSNNSLSVNGHEVNKHIDRAIKAGLLVDKQRNRRLIIKLPETMNLSSQYEQTMLYVNSIRALSKSQHSARYYRLSGVSFDNLKKISSSAALMLTSELSRWDDNIRNNLRPKVSNWDPEIFRKFHSLGFFDLFSNPPPSPAETPQSSSVHFVKYTKGNQQEKDHRELKQRLIELIGSKIKKWAFLHGGLDEAVTNVCHHAYPSNLEIKESDKNWYLTGAFDEHTRELKVIFCDQGIGIPRSLPSSKIWEKVTKAVSSFPPAKRRNHAILLKAAMEVKRTKTDKSDRGKGLPDMKEFIKQRGAGYLALMSGHGLYKLEIVDGKEIHKTDTLENPIKGTLIIWKVQL